jgi:hypothetical protein
MSKGWYAWKDIIALMQEINIIWRNIIYTEPWGLEVYVIS